MITKNDNNFSKKVFEGDKGRLLLQLSKSYKGDDRFKLDSRFKDDIQQQKLPEKIKKIADEEVLQKSQQKTKKIKKSEPPLIIKRFQPGTKLANQIIKKAQNKMKMIEGMKKHEEKMKMKQKQKIQKGVDKTKRAQLLIQRQLTNTQQKKPKFHIQVKGDRAKAFSPSQFKLFG